MSTFPLYPEAEVPDVEAQTPHATIVLPCYNEEEHVVLGVKREGAHERGGYYAAEPPGVPLVGLDIHTV